MKKYEINRRCILNQENPTPCKSMDVAINIVPVRKNNKFENFVLGINDSQQCYEEFGVGSTLGNRFEETRKFVESIEVDADIPSSLYPTSYSECGGVFGVKINVRGEDPIYAWVYNNHNGYYYHSIYYTDDTLKIDYLEEDCL